ncbi:MAG: endonuclease III [Deltaproteobacteria bacterium]|nr:endonuclease III [Candidatus Anaeroferrophillus wilburensis]MBN2888168.1 endonuclease III [Deltaproteobacteria bacterium]
MVLDAKFQESSNVRRLSRRQKAVLVVSELTRCYPRVECGLQYRNPFELLIATMLSAQCTDVQVNKVTPALFDRYPNAASFAGADLESIEAAIRSTGFFRNKARNIKACCQQLVELHGGQVPATMEELVKLPGVGRKTANVVLGEVFEPVGVVVDTHVKRLAGRIGLAKAADPVKIEQELMCIIPRQHWAMIAHLLISHGRQVCFARRPRCAECVLRQLCTYGRQQSAGR